MGRLLSVLIMVAVAASAQASTKRYETNVVRTLSDSSNFGGCMALVARSPVAEGLDCSPSWVSFSCTGDFAGKDAANRSFETAQIALLTGRQILISVDDTKKHNGFCFAPRIDLLR